MYNHILLVEDDPEDQFIFSEATKQLTDIAVSTAGNGIEAIELIKKALQPDIIFLDLNMPKMGGLDFLKTNAASHYFSGPIVVLTTSTMPWERDECIKLGAAHVYSKPSTMAELENIITGVLRNQFVHRQSV